MTVCTLCATPLPRHPIRDGEQGFCCPGCHAVFRILEAKGELDGFAQHPIFSQAVASGLISNPSLLEEIRQQKPSVDITERRKLYLEIQDMWCPSCAEVIKLFLLREAGVIECVVDYATDLACIEYSPRHLSEDDLRRFITKLGYQAHNIQDRVGTAVPKGTLLRFAVAAFCALNIMMLSYPIYAGFYHDDSSGLNTLLAWTACGFSLPVLTYSAFPIWQRFWNHIRLKRLGMETLVTLGVSAAFGLSCYQLIHGSTHVYFDSMSMIIVFVLLGKIIESKAKFSAKESLFRLTRSLPRRGRKRCADGQERFVPLKEIQVNDTILAYSGEKIVLDGIVSEGEGSIDESIMTGEAIPTYKRVGDQVLGGTCVQSGQLAIQVSTSPDESVLQHIISIVEQDLSHKGNYVRAIDTVVRWFVPLVLSIASLNLLLSLIAGAPFEPALLQTISIVLISCPCAVGIAAPLAESLLMHRLASLGALVRNRACLHDLGRESVYVFDKTGTVTEGKFRVLNGLDQPHPILPSLVRRSVHPISTAIRDHCDGGLPQQDLFVEELVGLGLRAEANGHRYLLGSNKLLEQHGIPAPAAPGYTTRVYFAEDEEIVHQIELGDQVRAEIPCLLSTLRNTHTCLLSGDHPNTVSHLAKSLHFNESHGGLSPLEKRNWIEEARRRGERVAMVGDGINDAPALGSAHIGISVVSASDISIQVSDILLTTADLHILPQLRRLACLGRRIVQQNLFWAFFYNVVGIGLAIHGSLSPLFATFAMISSSLIVILNALRLKRAD